MVQENLKRLSEGLTEISEVVFESIQKLGPLFEVLAELPWVTNGEFDTESYEKDLRATTAHNIRHGWTLAYEMGIVEYTDPDFRKCDQNEIDAYFYTHYTENNNAIFNKAVTHLNQQISPTRTDLLNACVANILTDNYRVTIPSLMTIIEGEVTDMLNTPSYGGKLKDKILAEIETKSIYVEDTLIYGSYRFIANNLHAFADFTKERPYGINRHWVLHGRDNTQLWTKFDGLRLLNVLVMLQEIKSLSDMYVEKA